MPLATCTSNRDEPIGSGAENTPDVATLPPAFAEKRQGEHRSEGRGAVAVYGNGSCQYMPPPAVAELSTTAMCAHETPPTACRAGWK